jgi:hypothetical protein
MEWKWFHGLNHIAPDCTNQPKPSWKKLQMTSDKFLDFLIMSKAPGFP